MNDRRVMAKLLDFIQDTKWETMDESLLNQAKNVSLIWLQ